MLLVIILISLKVATHCPLKAFSHFHCFEIFIFWLSYKMHYGYYTVKYSENGKKPSKYNQVNLKELKVPREPYSADN